MNDEKTENLADNTVKLEALLRCERCGQRPPMSGRKWCRPCALKWQRDPACQTAPLGYTGMIEDLCPQWHEEIPPRYHRATLDDLPQQLVEAFHALPDDRGLMLWGLPGRGKTHAMAAFAKHLWSEGWDFRRITWEGLCLTIRAGFDSGKSEETILDPLVEVSKLFIEDVGVTVSLGQQESEFSLRTFVTLLDARIEWCVATFITSNKSLEELAKSFDDRVGSRLYQACDIIQVTGEDKRKHGDCNRE